MIPSAQCVKNLHTYIIQHQRNFCSAYEVRNLVCFEFCQGYSQVTQWHCIYFPSLSKKGHFQQVTSIYCLNFYVYFSTFFPLNLQAIQTDGAYFVAGSSTFTVSAASYTGGLKSFSRSIKDAEKISVKS